MAVYLSNAFSLNMVPSANFTLVRVRKVTASDVGQFMASKSVISAIGHADTAKVISGILSYEIPANRMNVSLQANDVLFVAQYTGPRLCEGATQLPEGAVIEFFEVTLMPQGCGTCISNDCHICSLNNWLRGI